MAGPPAHPKYTITCACGGAAQTIARLPPDPSSAGLAAAAAAGGAAPPINLCHCRACRHTTGVLCTSTMRIDEPTGRDDAGLVFYRATPPFERVFCRTCGCHVFWRGTDPESGSQAWAVCTGVLEGPAEGEGEGEDTASHRWPEAQYARNINVAGTGDGGLSGFFPEVAGRAMEYHAHWGDEDPDDGVPVQPPRPPPGTSTAERLPASCYCGNVAFHITRPDASSRLPRSGYSDLIIPFHTGDPRIKNPDDEKWWLRPALSPGGGDGYDHDAKGQPAALTRYLAGTCACRSCRLVTGHEIQTWAFVPRSNIFFDVPAAADAAGVDSSNAGPREQQQQPQPLDFAALPAGTLQSYESSPGVLREFCPRCGATVFWHDKWRPDLVDVSVGLLDADEGARADTWLDWFTQRVSFAEDVGLGRSGPVRERAEALIAALEKGLKGWKQG